MIKALIIATVTTFTSLFAAANINPAEYIYPVEGAAKLFSANFGEMRPNHFHSGIDIKTDMVEGKRVVAAADGYVSRISVSPFGYGLAIYLAHPNGTTTVYGHLSKFRNDIQEFVERRRYELRQNSLNLYLTPAQIPVKQGDLIAYSGNSGSSAGPHVHYEVRESGLQKPLNSVAMGIIKPIDNIRPIITHVYYAESDTQDGVCYPGRINHYDVVRTGAGEYRLSGNRDVWVGREGYFIVAVTDRRDSVTNTFGIYDLKAKRDGELFYHYQQNGFTFDQTRYCNAVNYYPYQLSSRDNVFRLKRLEGLPVSMLKYTRQGGVVRSEAGDSSVIEIVATDDVGNVSRLEFNIRGKDDGDSFKAETSPEDRIIRLSESRTFTDFDGALRVKSPKRMTYEAIRYRASLDTTAIAPRRGVGIYSPRYKVLDALTPIHVAMEVSIRANIPAEEQPHATLVSVDNDGDESIVGGKYSGGYVTASSRDGGYYYVATDTEAPRISANFESGADLSARKSLSFNVSDNFSGIDNYTATIDGKWAALDLRRSRLTHTFRGEATGEEHTIIVKVSDECGNWSTIERKFKR